MGEQSRPEEKGSNRTSLGGLNAFSQYHSVQLKIEVMTNIISLKLLAELLAYGARTEKSQRMCS